MDTVLGRVRALSRPRLAVLACVALALVALLLRYPQAASDLGDVARANAALSYADREIGGGNSVFPDHDVLYQARARIPHDEAYEVAVGPPLDGWTALTGDYAAGFAVSFLMPRRPGEGPWVLCVGCNRADEPGEVVWEGQNGMALIRRSG